MWGGEQLVLPAFFPGGVLLQDLQYPRGFWKHVFEPIIRRSAGLGKGPDRGRSRHT